MQIVAVEKTLTRFPPRASCYLCRQRATREKEKAESVDGDHESFDERIFAGKGNRLSRTFRDDGTRQLDRRSCVKARGGTWFVEKVLSRRKRNQTRHRSVGDRTSRQERRRGKVARDANEEESEVKIRGAFVLFARRVRRALSRKHKSSNDDDLRNRKT